MTADSRPLVVVTGAGGAVGRAVVAALSDQGASILGLDIDEDALAKLRADRVQTAVCDVTDGDQLRRACLTAGQSLAPPVGFFNNVGTEGPLKPVRELSEADLAATFRVNVTGVVVGMRIAIDLMLEAGRGGRILNMASGSGLRGAAGMGAYVASKHAVVGLTKCAALEVAESGIAVNALCPGCIDTPMMRRVEHGLGEQEGFLAPTIPVGRYGEVEEIAQTAAWLLLYSPLFLTGAALPIDGGWAAN